MASIRSRIGSLLGAGCIAAALLAAVPAAAQVVVLKSSGPSAGEYYPGRVLGSTNAIHLKAGDRLTIKVGDETRSVAGPGDITVAAPPTVVDSLKSMLTADKVRYQVFTASRGAKTDDPRHGNLWLIDVSSSATFCIAPDAQPGMVRWTAGQDDKVQITPSGGGQATVLTWAHDQSTLPWPASLSTADGLAYDVRVNDQDPVTITWRRVKGPADGVTAFAHDLMSAGCDQQVDTLMAMLP